MKDSILRFISSRCFLAFLVYLPGIRSYSQTLEKKPDSIPVQLHVYGSFRGHFALYNKELEIQENASRIGFEISTTHHKIRYFTGVELQVNMFRSEVSFNLNANTTGGYLVADRVQNRQVFSGRLGYIGMDLGKWGYLVLGKQKSIYYDVSGFTDRFNVFGGGATATYNAGTDGGFTGTGRADQALTYRNTSGRFSYGLQTQFVNTTNRRFFDGIGFNIRAALTPHFNLGIAYNKAFLNKSLIGSGEFIGLKNNPEYLAIGTSYITNQLELAAVIAKHSNGDLTTGKLPDPVAGNTYPAVVFNATGYELFIRYRWKNWRFTGGGNYYKPDTEVQTATGENPLYKNFKRSYLILGAEYHPLPYGRFYIESRITDSETAQGIKEPTVNTIGIRLDFDRIFERSF
ncbi:porin [Flavihumibacter sp. CACIAM 22H1]|uniref:porin n=1 Tax=Flavihumibacter sp. CACIAM 22H1 TaxID=1812911 RepID=UPI0007A80D46|nr:porin [Flavihumibacter sp. CACIAM 22H1]KYP14596.1 MAG: hypothetical protein A1D16_16020 [Flavihumibacter sp. CACIAM 22H1]